MFPQSSEALLPPNKSCLLGDTICRAPSVTGCCARRLNSDPSACTKRTCCRAGNVGRIQLASPGLHQQGQSTLQTPRESTGLEAGAANTKAPWWLAPLPTITPRQAWTQKHVPCAAQGVLSVIPISPAFRFGLLETAGGGLVLEDAPYSWGKLAPGQQYSPSVLLMGKGAHPRAAGWDVLALSPPPPCFARWSDLCSDRL